jgi:GNAT superfamily N-acetyltransferase
MLGARHGAGSGRAPPPGRCGRELLEAAESLVRELGCSDVEITCSRSRGAARAFYADRGYEDVCRSNARFKRALALE